MRPLLPLSPLCCATCTYLLITNREFARRNLVVLSKFLEFLDRLRLGHRNSESNV